MALADLIDWLDEFTGLQNIWYIKRLSGNDTLVNGSHQAGPYIPKNILFGIFPSLNKKEVKNPRVLFDLCVDSHVDCREAQAIWYNNKYHGSAAKSPRNEARITGWGGASSALLDPDSTGALVIFAFVKLADCDARECHTWVCRDSNRRRYC